MDIAPYRGVGHHHALADAGSADRHLAPDAHSRVSADPDADTLAFGNTNRDSHSHAHVDCLRNGHGYPHTDGQPNGDWHRHTYRFAHSHRRTEP